MRNVWHKLLNVGTKYLVSERPEIRTRAQVPVTDATSYRWPVIKQNGYIL